MFDDEIDDIENFFGGGGAPAISFKSNKGEWVVGIILEKPDIQNQIDVQTKKVKTYEDGKPKKQAVLTILTEMRDPEIEDDDGKRRLYVKGNMTFELKKTLKEMGVRAPVPGGKIAVRWVGEKPTGQIQPMKLYEVRYAAPTAETMAEVAKYNGGSSSSNADPFADAAKPASAPPAQQQPAGQSTLASMRASGNAGADAPF